MSIFIPVVGQVAAKDLLSGEEVVECFPASMARGRWRSVGRLFSITSHRLLFSPNQLDSLQGAGPWSVAKESIPSVEIDPPHLSPTFWPVGDFLQSRLLIRSADGSIDYFLVAQVRSVRKRLLDTFKISTQSST